MRLWTAVALGLLGLTAAVNPLSAQWIWFGGGPTFPVSDYGDYADTGFLLIGGVGLPVGEAGLSAGVGGFFGQNSHSDVDGDKTSPFGIHGWVGYDLAGPNAESSIYLGGEIGVLWHKYSSDLFEESTDSGLGIGGVVGYFFPLGSVNGWVEGRLQHASIDDENTSFVGIMAGVSVPLGG